jgi:HEAT repeat protein
MLSMLKLMRLSSALKDRRNKQNAFTAVMELGRLRTRKSVTLLLEALDRNDDVARCAARELGKMGDAAAVVPLAGALRRPETGQAAAEALATLGAPSVDALVTALGDPNGAARALAAEALGKIGDRRAVEPLSNVLAQDAEYGVRIAAAAALGQLKDQRAIWVLVATLKLRDETQSERQQDLAA